MPVCVCERERERGGGEWRGEVETKFKYRMLQATLTRVVRATKPHKRSPSKVRVKGMTCL